MSQRKFVALLPMKGNSERVPGKNFRPIAGKPLFRWMLDELLRVPEIAQVVINTDAADQLREAGLPETDRVLLRERKPELCGDLVSMNRVLADDIEAVAADGYLMTHATNPLLSARTIGEAIEAFEEDAACDSLFTVTKVQTRFYRADGSAVNHDPKELIRTQDLEPWYEENSCLYLFSRESFAATGARIGERPRLHEIPAREAVDIDEPDDWLVAEALLHARK